MRLSIGIQVLFVSMMLVLSACGKDKKSPQDTNNSEQTTEKTQKFRVIAYAESPAEVTESEIVVFEENEARAPVKDKSGRSLECVAKTIELVADYTVNDNQITMGSGENQKTFSRISGKSGEVFGEWKVADRVDEQTGALVEISIKIKQEAFGVQVVCTLPE